ncbi:hypothetical protein J2T57_001646 [Natronocella acetinitrilica]|uniref:Uncharacterized protein n=1 Tax=Natronocella acetinitrilica TaxID=414046 RepID=A0AAE3G2Q0_9GAMM|nr:hypothetical protein [Natronocella acetinitrilica]MCP1674544.1 hypothetical protein [Natronocella acetinitrilica]
MLSLSLDVRGADRRIGGLASPGVVLAQEVYALLEEAIRRSTLPA